MVNFKQLLGGPIPDTDTDPDMQKSFRKYARKEYEGAFRAARVYRDKSALIAFVNGPEIVIPDIIEFESVLRQLVNTGRQQWSETDPAWKLTR